MNGGGGEDGEGEKLVLSVGALGLMGRGKAGSNLSKICILQMHLYNSLFT